MQAARAQAPINIMLIDDSAVVRGLISRALQKDRQLHIVATASNGQMALDVLPRHKVDIIILDIEMPVMDGLTALPKLLELSPHSSVIMASTLTLRNADISLKAMAMGASDYLAKPSAQDHESLATFYQELTDKVRALGGAAQIQREQGRKSVSVETVEERDNEAAPSYPEVPVPSRKLQALAIAASTGGPQALLKMFSSLKGKTLNVPIFVTQHIPATFTTILAEHIKADSGFLCKEGEDGEVVKAGVIYIAPGNYHMLVKSEKGTATISLNQDPPVNFCRPAADPMMQSLAKTYGAALVGVVLTGMGQDGLVGAQHIKEAGGIIVAQDKESSVVWGMPGAISRANVADGILPLSEIAPYVTRAGGVS